MNLKFEPVVTRTTVAAVITAVCALVGVNVTDGVVQAVAGVVATIAPLVAGFLARRHVTPVAKTQQPVAPAAPDGGHGAVDLLVVALLVALLVLAILRLA